MMYEETYDHAKACPLCYTMSQHPEALEEDPAWVLCTPNDEGHPLCLPVQLGTLLRAYHQEERPITDAQARIYQLVVYAFSHAAIQDHDAGATPAYTCKVATEAAIVLDEQLQLYALKPAALQLATRWQDRMYVMQKQEQGG